MRRIAIIAVLMTFVVLLAAGCAGQNQIASQRGGVEWVHNDLAAGKRQAREQSKKIFLYFGAGY